MRKKAVGYLARCNDVAAVLEREGAQEDANAIRRAVREVWKLRREQTRRGELLRVMRERVASVVERCETALRGVG